MVERMSVSVTKELLEWIDKMIEKGYFASRSHAFVFSISHVKRFYEENKHLP